MFRRISVLGDGFPREIVFQTSKPSTGTGELSSLPPRMEKKGKYVRGKSRTSWSSMRRILKTSSVRPHFFFPFFPFLAIAHLYNTTWHVLKKKSVLGNILGANVLNRVFKYVWRKISILYFTECRFGLIRKWLY